MIGAFQAIRTPHPTYFALMVLCPDTGLSEARITVSFTSVKKEPDISSQVP